MFGGFGFSHAQRAMQARNQKPKRGWCKCKPEKGALDQSKIASVLGSEAVCLKCQKRIKPAGK